MKRKGERMGRRLPHENEDLKTPGIRDIGGDGEGQKAKASDRIGGGGPGTPGRVRRWEGRNDPGEYNGGAETRSSKVTWEGAQVEELSPGAGMKAEVQRKV